MIIRCKIYRVSIFVVCAQHENIFATKISKSMVVAIDTHFIRSKEQMTGPHNYYSILVETGLICGMWLFVQVGWQGGLEVGLAINWRLHPQMHMSHQKN